MRLLCVLGFFLQAAQEDPDGLLRRLRSERIEERGETSRKLANLGRDLRPELEALTRDPDKEVSRRAMDILREKDGREELRVLRAAGRVRSVDLKNATLDQAAKVVFRGFGVNYRIDQADGDLAITAVTLEFKDAGFWEAVDQFCRAASLRHQSEVQIGPRCSSLTFTRPLPWPRHFDTVGDARVFAGVVVMGGGGANHGDLSARLSVAFAPWAVPKRARIEGLRIAGQAVAEHEIYRDLRKREVELPRMGLMLTVGDLWRGGDCVKRESLKGAPMVTVEGTLVLTQDGPRGSAELRAPFSIPGLAVPPVPAR
jgi:hypothetical protein